MTRNKLGWTAADWAFSPTIRAHLEETARVIYESRKSNPNRLRRGPTNTNALMRTGSGGVAGKGGGRRMSSASVESTRSTPGGAGLVGGLASSFKGNWFGLGGEHTRPSMEDTRRW